MRRRLARATLPALTAAFLIVVMASPASAKMWPFSIEIAPQSPTAGEAFEITVRCWRDLEHTDRTRCPAVGSWFDGFLWAVPAGSDRPDAEAIPVEFVRRGGELLASLELVTAGAWNLCVWAPSPCAADADPGYPSRIQVLVVDPSPTLAVASSPAARAGASSSDEADGGPTGPVAAAVLAVALAGAFGVRRSRRR
jgi:hypothetical protein